VSTSPRLPLTGTRVIDVSTSYAGPTATMYLGDLGADVIKVERPGGDDARTWGPPFVGKESAWFLSANRNKRSVCIDLSKRDGLDLLYRLVRDADVFVENFNPAKLERLGLAPEQLRPHAPDLIYCALSGFGLDGPDRARPGYDLIAQARSGLMSVTGARGGPPQRVSTALSDVVAGMLAALAVTASLLRRAETGEGDVIDISLAEADLALLAPRIAAYLAGGPEPRPSGGTDSVLAIYQGFETADDVIVLAVGNDQIWQRCCEVLGLDDLAADAALSTNAGRVADRERLVETIAARVAEEPSGYWLERFAAAGVQCQPVRRLSEVVRDEQFRFRGIFGEYEHPRAGRYSAVQAPWRMWSSGRGPGTPAPVLGADTVSVLTESGVGAQEIEQLLATGAIWANRPEL
jgi:crotonobetainyl-CoA:carnitine CoA-transferase CaiB-like acyl-CoA transferase